jgi:excisionase family DNA binding protein
MLTLGQAAKETGISKPTISKAIKKGRLSATQTAQGEYQIDPAELFRVYPLASKLPVTPLHGKPPIYTKNLQRELEILREERTREREQLEATIADLRADRERLLKVIEEQAGTVKQLTYQPKLEPEPSPEATPQNPPPWPARVNWWLVLAVAAVGAVLGSGLVAVVVRATGGKLF